MSGAPNQIVVTMDMVGPRCVRFVTTYDKHQFTISGDNAESMAVAYRAARDAGRSEEFFASLSGTTPPVPAKPIGELAPKAVNTIPVLFASETPCIALADLERFVTTLVTDLLRRGAVKP